MYIYMCIYIYVYIYIYIYIEWVNIRGTIYQFIFSSWKHFTFPNRLMHLLKLTLNNIKPVKMYVFCHFWLISPSPFSLFLGKIVFYNVENMKNLISCVMLHWNTTLYFRDLTLVHHGGVSWMTPISHVDAFSKFLVLMWCEYLVVTQRFIHCVDVMWL